MGGAKKKGLAQMEKTQVTQEKVVAQKKKEKSAPAEKRLKGVEIPSINDPKILGEIKRMSALTPFAVASQFNIRVSAAKDLLEELARKRIIESVGGNARVRVYRTAAA